MIAKNRLFYLDDITLEAKSTKHNQKKYNTNSKGRKGLSAKTNIAYKKSVVKNPSKKYSNSANRNHIVVKITGGAKDKISNKNHIDYITRNGKIPIYDQDGYKSYREIATKNINRLIDYDDSKEGSKKTYQIVFSLSGKTDEDTLKEIVKSVAQEQFKDNTFYYALHNDTDNTHVHLVVARKSLSCEKRLEIRKNKLNKIKEFYAKKCNEKGLNVTFESRTIKNEKEGLTPVHIEKRKNADVYKVLDYGKAPYKFKDGSKDSFYVILETKNGKLKDQWSKGFEDEIISKDIKRGDYIKIKKQNKDISSVNNFVKSVWDMEKVENPFTENVQAIIKDFGKESYRFEEKGKQSYYIIYEDDKGKVTDKWGLKFENYINENEIQRGDKVNINLETLSISKLNDTKKIDDFKKSINSGMKI
ncbi:relaxase/mobilization nuclease domain-containing protein [Pasteurella atlantica]|uniref:relaxase/mobilization nuclease domain-containing protein n=1 Tax=Phocoenobacter atlanticus TaxID=3416742 RepID=UPI002743A64A|nr:relaxase/mobilization nuclease domain-containing protein [Pasteurella atlantica]MDP8042520.1 relaxase/mobilization nuclease domain-containing protein [Pasteurella atlantica]